MPRVLKADQKVRNYQLKREMSKGYFALSWEAVTPSGQSVFFKQYKSPVPDVAWYQDFIKYQKALRGRLEENRVQQLALKFVDAFEEVVGTRTFFQVFEFFEAGKDLRSLLDEAHTRPKALSWENRLTYAKVFLAGLRMLHEARIVHCDLKPDNLHLVKDDTLLSGYRLKLIDMDFSILSDKKAPWHGQISYIGSPCYHSPEHLELARAPGPESDVFTAALILYELLGNGHPYSSEDDYARVVKAYSAPALTFRDALPPPADTRLAAEMVRCALHPNPDKRPTAAELHQALLGRLPDSKVEKEAKKDVKKEPKVVPIIKETRPEERKTDKPAETKSDSPKETPRPPSKSTKPEAAVETRQEPRRASLRLTHTSGKSLTFHVGCALGRRLCQDFSDEVRFLDETQQYTLLSKDDGSWAVVPNPTTTNQTLLNGKQLTTETNLQPGDVLAVGKEGKKAVLPLTVHLE